MKIATILGILVALPIFLDISHGLQLAPQYSATIEKGSVVPVSWLIGPVIIAAFASFKRKIFYPVDTLVLVYVVAATIALLVGIITNGARYIPHGALQPTIYYLQTVAPTVWFFVPRFFLSEVDGYEQSLRRVNQFYIGLVVTVAASLIGYLCQTLISGGGLTHYSMMTPHIGPFYNFKMKRFFPLLSASLAVWSFAHLLILGFKGRGRYFFLLGLMIGAMGVLTTWSRTALLVLMLGLGFTMVRMLRVARRNVVHRLMAFSAISVLAIGMATPFFLQGNLLYSVTRLADTLSTVSGDDSLGVGDVRRFTRMKGGVEHGVLSFTGDRYRMRTSRDQSGTGSQPHLWVTENGYLSVAVRSGTFGFLCFVGLVLIEVYWVNKQAKFCLDISKKQWNYRDNAASILSVFGISIGIFAIGIIFLNIPTEPYTSTIFWSTFGIIEVLRHKKSSLIA